MNKEAIIHPCVVVFDTAKFGDDTRRKIIRSAMRLKKFRNLEIPFMIDKEKESIARYSNELRN